MELFGKRKSKEPNIQEMVTQADVERLVAGSGREDARQAASSALRTINSDPRVVEKDPVARDGMLKIVEATSAWEAGSTPA